MKVQSPIVGKMTGRNARTIFQSYNGATYARSMPGVFHYPDTPAQKAKGIIYNRIMNQIRSFYAEYLQFIDESQRGNKNSFGVMAKGIFNVMKPFLSDPFASRPNWFGLDKYCQVRVKFELPNIYIENDKIHISAVTRIKTFRRYFHGRDILIMLFCPASNNFIFFYTKYQNGIVNEDLTNEFNWDSSMKLYCYVATASDNFVSNFYKVIL